ncbi:hypothetical protein [Actinoalloteichus sp. AHMU CJ021]|uniref:hypothetical protein n=1 Tax=Actinoalloteichus sp. AHMU CJ021 TaxID=2072503 RepID=UPI0026796DAB
MQLETTCAYFGGKNAKQLNTELNGPGHGGSSSEAYASWSNVGTSFGDLAEYIKGALARAADAHQGEAADTSRAATLPLVTYADQAREQSHAIRDSISSQGLSRTNAVHNIPEGQDEPKKEGFEVILPSSWTGHGDRMEAYEAENEAAREVMQTYQNETNNVLMSVPSFEEVPSTTYSAKGTTNPESIGNGIPGGAPSVPSVGGSGGGGGGGYGGGTPGGGMNWNGTGGGGGGGGGGGYTPPSPSAPNPGAPVTPIGDGPGAVRPDLVAPSPGGQFPGGNLPPGAGPLPGGGPGGGWGGMPPGGMPPGGMPPGGMPPGGGGPGGPGRGAPRAGQGVPGRNGGTGTQARRALLSRGV